MEELQFDKLWVIREAAAIGTGTQTLIIEKTARDRLEIPLPQGGDWDRSQFIKLFRTGVCRESGLFPIYSLDQMKFKFKQADTESRSRLILIMGTVESSSQPEFLRVFRNVQHTANVETHLECRDEPDCIDRIVVVAETASRGYFLRSEGSYPNSFTLVVSSKSNGLLLSESFAHGPFQVMEAGVCGRFEFELPFRVPTEKLRHQCKFVIKAKGSNAWLPRHIIVLGVSDGLYATIGGRLNLDDYWMSTSPEHKSQLELLSWINTQSVSRRSKQNKTSRKLQ